MTILEDGPSRKGTQPPAPSPSDSSIAQAFREEVASIGRMAGNAVARRAISHFISIVQARAVKNAAMRADSQQNTDDEVRAWVDRHDLGNMGLTDARAAIEDAQSIDHAPLSAPAAAVGGEVDRIAKIMREDCPGSTESQILATARRIATPAAPVGGFVLVPREPTEKMVIDGFESEPDAFFSTPEEWDAYEAMTGCQRAAHRARLCWAAMIAAAPTSADDPNLAWFDSVAATAKPSAKDGVME